MKSKDDKLFSNYQYPSTTVKRLVIGDTQYASMFRGDGDKLLYQVKNLMRLGNLNQFKATRLFDNGTIIEAKSVFGMDFITINVSGVQLPLVPSCSITLYNVPEEVPPMKWYEDGIHDSEWLITHPDGELEVEGIDYIKTHYRLTSESCDNCLAKFSICKTKELEKTYGWTAPQTCKPFTFDKPEGIPYYQGYPDASPPIPPDPENHCIHGNCQAEIIKFGHDENGGYFLWKAYTEWSSLGPTFVGDFTKSGLGYLLLRAFINLNGVELCTSESSIVKVDCCLKLLVGRIPVIYWEKCIGGGLCIAPSEGTIEEDLDYFWQVGGWISMGLWAKGNWCRPMTWTLSGIGELNFSEDGSSGGYVVPYTDLGVILDALDCHSSYQISIEGTDRCGTKDSITFKSTPCCDTAAALSLGYTTLVMACSGGGSQQTLTAGGGCAPYEWSLSGGGTLVDNEDGTALYTSPATNAECSSNPTITLTDCCGGSAHIHIAVNCDTADDDAYVVWVDNVTYYTANCGISCGYGNGPIYQHLIDAYVYNCDGTLYRTQANAILFYSPVSSPILTSNQTVCNYGGGNIYTLATTGWHLATGGVAGGNCGCTDPYYQGCGLWYNNGVSNSAPGSSTATAIPGQNDSWDVRTATQKTAGCCPLNPYTGLPF